MGHEPSTSASRERTASVIQNGGPAGAVYGLGLIGALVYYIQAADSFWMGVVGVAKALVWPAFVVYRLLGGA